MDVMVSIRLDEKRYGVIKYLSETENVPKSEAIREIFDMGRIDLAVKLYREDKVSLETASKLAGLNMSDFIDALSSRGINLNLTVNDFRESLKNVKRIMKNRYREANK